MNMNNFFLLCQAFLDWKIIEETNSVNEDLLLSTLIIQTKFALKYLIIQTKFALKYLIIQKKENLEKKRDFAYFTFSTILRVLAIHINFQKNTKYN